MLISVDILSARFRLRGDTLLDMTRKSKTPIMNITSVIDYNLQIADGYRAQTAYLAAEILHDKTAVKEKLINNRNPR